jgi:hypothetical protein
MSNHIIRRGMTSYAIASVSYGNCTIPYDFEHEHDVVHDAVPLASSKLECDLRGRSSRLPLRPPRRLKIADNHKEGI